MFGYHGRYLRVDLAAGAATWVALAENVLRRFLGGVGLGTFLLHRECPRGIDPLAPASPLIFCLSPLVGTPLTTSAKVGRRPARRSFPGSRVAARTAS
jgi:aldehyde:ferredoxin oxidoreductase